MRGFGFILVLALLAALSSWFLWHIEAGLQTDPAAAAAPLLIIDRLRATSLDTQGRPDYVLTATRAERLAGDRGSTLDAPQLETFLPDRSPEWLLRAGRGWVAADGQRVRLLDQVSLERWGAAAPRSDNPADAASASADASPARDELPLTIRTAELLVYPAERLIENDLPVQVDTLNGQLRGVGLRGRLNERQLELREHVTSRYLPR